MENLAVNNPTRRNFLRIAPVAAAAGLALADATLFASYAAGQNATPAAPAGFQLFTAQRIQDGMKALQAKPGNDNFFGSRECTVVLTTETAKSAKEFEWHENRDHVLLILKGSTVYEVGGTPKNGRNTKPGEWLAPAAEGATSLTLKKGDMLVIPRGTLHKRSTAESVTLFLISPMGTVTA
jgi:mannose-6-phosphate isomerase-like protein (cupin superfamily)